MKLDKNGLDLLKELEGLRLKPYLCTAGIPTIGFGNTYYIDGTRVKMTDKSITVGYAYELFMSVSKYYEDAINNNVTSEINQHQFNALFCFCYNVGVSAFKKSTLLRYVNSYPKSLDLIHTAFLLWSGKKNVLLLRQEKQFKEYCK